MILFLIIAAMVWVALSPDRVASPTRAAVMAGARGAGHSGRAAASNRWAAGAPARAARRKQRGKTRTGRVVNATGTGLAGAGRILVGATGTAGAAAAGAARAAGYEFADARELHRHRRSQHGNRTDDVARLVRDTLNPLGQQTSLRQRMRDFVRDLPGVLRPGTRSRTQASGCVGCGRGTADVVHRDSGVTLCWGCHTRAARTGDLDPGDYDVLTGTDRYQPPAPSEQPEPSTTDQPAPAETQPTQTQPGPVGPSPEEQAQQALRVHEDTAPVPPTALGDEATAEQAAAFERDQARYEAAKAQWDLTREQLRAQVAAARARAEAAAAHAAAAAAGDQDPAVQALLAGLSTASAQEAARLLADAPDDVVARALAWQDAAQTSLPTREGSTTPTRTTDEMETTDMPTTLDIANADALLAVAKAFAAAAEAASQLQAVAMNAQNLPDALGYGPGTKVLAVIVALAELAPDPKQLGEFADTLPLLERELIAQLNRNEVIDADGLTGEATKHTIS